MHCTETRFTICHKKNSQSQNHRDIPNVLGYLRGYAVECVGTMYEGTHCHRVGIPVISIPLKLKGQVNY